MMPLDEKQTTVGSSSDAASSRFEAIRRLLADPARYPDRSRAVEVIETHISCVFVADRLVYKLKKPVRFEFVDFSTVEARRTACEDELRLNRRLAPDAYLRVVPITESSDGTLSLDGSGEPVEWVVEMRRLPTDRSLAARIASREVRVAEVDSLARVLGDFYAGAPQAEIDAAEYRGEVEHHVRANLKELSEAVSDDLAVATRRAHGAQLQMLLLRGEVFDERVAAGRVVDGHGDLRPEHVILSEPPVVFDCLEFDERLRRLDVADELCFLAMECERLGTAWVGDEVLKKCLARIDDRPPTELLAFYKSYRACVRAKVAALRARQLLAIAQAAAKEEVAEYLRLADAQARRCVRPLLIVVSGLMGSGKSTLAVTIAERLSLPVLQTDAVRRALFPAADAQVEYNTAHYSVENRAAVYGELLRRASEVLSQGESVIVDGTFLSAATIEQAVAMATSAAALALVVRCECDEATARQRIAARIALGGNLSEARPELYDRQRAEVEPIRAGVAQVLVDTRMDSSFQVELVFSRLKGLISN